GFGSNSASALLSQFLNWLEYATKKERFEIPRVTPGAGVVQVLTIHAAKGLEWDFVAIPNLVEDDFPSKPRSVSGWLSGAELPYPLRGDAGSLPVFDFQNAAIQSELKSASDQFKADNKEHQLREEFRLIYVAITRAKEALLLSGSYWKPANSGSRKPSRFMTELAEGNFQFPDLASAENPLDLSPRQKSWPLEPIGEVHAAIVENSASEVDKASAKLDRVSAEDLRSSSIHQEIDLLLKEQDDRIQRLGQVELPVRIPASKFKEFITDLPAQAARYLRPVPTEPYRATKAGTAFHSWVEDFIISEVDQAPQEIFELTEIFKNSRFKNQSPADVEIEINLTRGSNTFVCKLDAVFQSGDRFEIVDWKTGAAPKDKATEQQMILQLALYRFAYSALKKIPIEKIDVCFYFVGDDIELRPQKVPAPEELVKMWEELFA
ncbi:MAG: ATP-dependent helicase, partial [Actinobacteria bacterium]|nr:ATP-dependent helicase [Actinomycetota bacterium]